MRVYREESTNQSGNGILIRCQRIGRVNAEGRKYGCRTVTDRESVGVRWRKMARVWLEEKGNRHLAGWKRNFQFKGNDHSATGYCDTVPTIYIYIYVSIHVHSCIYLYIKTSLNPLALSTSIGCFPLTRFASPSLYLYLLLATHAASSTGQTRIVISAFDSALYTVRLLVAPFDERLPHVCWGGVRGLKIRGRMRPRWKRVQRNRARTATLWLVGGEPGERVEFTLDAARYAE